MQKTKFTRLEKLLFLSPLLLLIIPLIQYLQSDQLEREMARLTEKNSIDCGVARGITTGYNERWLDPNAADACAVAAFKTDKPFCVRFIKNPYKGDQIYSMGILRTSDGKIHFLSCHTRRGWWKRTLYFDNRICRTATIMQNFVSNASGTKTTQRFVGCADCELENAYCELRDRN